MKILYVVDKDIRGYLKNIKSLDSIEYISSNELEEKLTFSFDKKTIVTVSNHFNLSIETTKIYLKVLRYIYNLDLTENKFQIIYKIKDYCLQNNLLTFNNYINKIKDYSIIFKYKAPLFLKTLLNKLNIKEEIDYFIPLNNSVCSFSSIDDEICFVCEKIIKLINEGKDINKIKIINKCSDYNYKLELYLNMYNIPYYVNKKIPIYQTHLVKKFISILENNNIENGLKILLDDIKNSTDQEIYSSIVSIVNSYPFNCNYEEIKNSLIYDFKHTYKKINKLKKCVNITSKVCDDDYIFILGFNNETYPIIHRDEDFLNDKDKIKIGLLTSKDLNDKDKNNVIRVLSYPNLTISYSTLSYKNNYTLSSIAKDLNFNIIDNIKLENTYSHKVNMLRYTSLLDNNSINEELRSFYSTYNDMEYKNYDNKFKGVDINLLYDYLNNYLPLSFSHLDTYYNCSFRYYLANILKIDIYQDNFSAFIGSLYHYVLSFAFKDEKSYFLDPTQSRIYRMNEFDKGILFKDDFDFEQRWQEALSDRILSSKELVLLEKFKKGLHFIIDNIHQQNEFINYHDSLEEQEVVYYIDGPLKIRFKGLIDKILYKDCIDENGTSIRYSVIIDYKTYIPSLSIENLDYGLNMQLPIYIHLLRKVKGFENSKIYGFYLQSILFDDTLKHNPKKSIDEQNKNNMKLKGYSINPVYQNGEFDTTRPNSNIIDKLKTNKDGSYAKDALILHEEDIELIENISSNKIKEAVENISLGKFSINPKYIDNKLVGCSFCKFKDICYKKYEDTLYLDDSKKIFKKGGDNDAMDE